MKKLGIVLIAVAVAIPLFYVLPKFVHAVVELVVRMTSPLSLVLVFAGMVLIALGGRK